MRREAGCCREETRREGEETRREGSGCREESEVQKRSNQEGSDY